MFKTCTVNDEEWIDVPDYEGFYKVSNLGRVKSCNVNKRNRFTSFENKGRVLKQSIGVRGYKVLNLCKKTVQIQRYVHTLVAAAFLNHNSDDRTLVVDHIDNDKLNNNLSNLQVITQRENSSKDKKGFSSRYVGVYFSKANSKWRSMIRINDKKTHLGYFENEYDAHVAYNNKLKEINYV